MDRDLVLSGLKDATPASSGWKVCTYRGELTRGGLLRNCISVDGWGCRCAILAGATSIPVYPCVNRDHFPLLLP
jgi:hypothetical protein